MIGVGIGVRKSVVRRSTSTEKNNARGWEAAGGVDECTKGFMAERALREGSDHLLIVRGGAVVRQGAPGLGGIGIRCVVAAGSRLGRGDGHPRPRGRVQGG